MIVLKRSLLICFGVTCGIAASVVAAELYYHFLIRPKLEWHDPNTAFDSQLGWRPVAGRAISHSWGPISANDDGFRSSPVDQNRKQILLLGDSVAWGFGVGDPNSLGYLLEDRLKPRNLQLTNLAVSGYGIDQSYLRLTECFSKFSNRVGAIILVICSKNDFNDTTSNFTSGKRKMLYRINDASLELTNHPISRFNRRNLLSDSFVISSLSTAFPSFGRLVGWIAGDTRLDRAEGRLVIIRLLRMMRQEAANRGAPFIVVLSPDEERDFPTAGERYQIFRSLLDEARIPFIDYQRFLADQKVSLREIYFDRWHYNSRGNGILGERLLSELSTAGVF